MKNSITCPEHRLIIAADFKRPEGETGKMISSTVGQIRGLLETLKATGVMMKVNADLRAVGYDLLDEIVTAGFPVFADLKLCDIPETLSRDGGLLKEIFGRPNIVTVMCSAGIDAMKGLYEALPEVEVVGVTILTSQKEDEVQALYNCSIPDAVLRLAHQAEKAGIDGLVASPAEAEMLRKEFGDRFTINTPAIRPQWSIVAGDDQNAKRVKTPYDAIRAGADRIVVGRPVAQAGNKREAVVKTLHEITLARPSV